MFTLVIYSRLSMLPHDGMLIHTFVGVDGVALAVRENRLHPYWAQEALPF